MSFLAKILGRNPTASEAARILAEHHAKQRRMSERDNLRTTTDDLRARLGLPAWDWTKGGVA